MNSIFVRNYIGSLVIILVATGQAAATDDPDSFMDDILEQVKLEDSEAVYNLMFPQEMADIMPLGTKGMLTRELETIFDLYGPPAEFELLEEQIETSRIQTRIYVGYHDQLPTYWKFSLYKREAGWAVSRVLFGDSKLKEAILGR